MAYNKQKDLIDTSFGNFDDFEKNDNIFESKLRQIFEKFGTLNCSDAICLLADYLNVYNKCFKKKEFNGFILKNDDLTELFVRRYVEQSFLANYAEIEDTDKFFVYLQDLRERYDLYCNSLNSRSLLFKGYQDEGISNSDSDVLILPDELTDYSFDDNRIPVYFKVLKNGDYQLIISNRIIAKDLVRVEEVLKNFDFWEFTGENYFEQGVNPHLSILRNHINGNKFVIGKQNIGFLFYGYINYMILAYVNYCKMVKLSSRLDNIEKKNKSVIDNN